MYNRVDALITSPESRKYFSPTPPLLLLSFLCSHLLILTPFSISPPPAPLLPLTLLTPLLRAPSTYLTQSIYRTYRIYLSTLSTVPRLIYLPIFLLYLPYLPTNLLILCNYPYLTTCTIHPTLSILPTYPTLLVIYT